MRYARALPLLTVASALAAVALFIAPSVTTLHAQAPAEAMWTYFNPPLLDQNGKLVQDRTLRQTLLDEIDHANGSIQIVADSITDLEIRNHLMAALQGVQRRNRVRVQLLLDKTAWKRTGSQVAALIGAGAEVLTDRVPGGDLSETFFILDGQTVLTGSFSLTAAGANNAEHLVIFQSAIHSERFRLHFNALWNSGGPPQ